MLEGLKMKYPGIDNPHKQRENKGHDRQTGRGSVQNLKVKERQEKVNTYCKIWEQYNLRFADL
jgi:hypothetical protein